MGDCDGEPKPVRRTDDPNPHPGGGRRRRKSRRGGCRRREDNEAVRTVDRGSRIENGRSKITPPARSSILGQNVSGFSKACCVNISSFNPVLKRMSSSVKIVLVPSAGVLISTRFATQTPEIFSRLPAFRTRSFWPCLSYISAITV